MGRIIHVELTSADPEQAAAFYGATFGWESKASPYAAGYLLAATGAGESHEIPGQGWVAYVRDPEGTVLGLRQPV
jgi:predicted enzyme related to lactoylglutathione lyase